MQDYAWQEILSLLSKSLDKSRFETWILPLVFIENKNNETLVLLVQNHFISDFLDQHYKDLILSQSKKIIPTLKNIEFIIKKEETLSPLPPPAASDTSSLTTSSPPPSPSPSRTKNTYTLNNQYTFELFVSGPGNEFAKNASFAVAENPGKTKFNPLLIYGGVGLGKTHLLHAIGNFVISHKNSLNVNFMTSEEFYLNFIDAIKNSKTKVFSERFRQSDVLLVDDIQFIAGKERTQEEFFYIFNTLYQNGKQIVLTSDLLPHEIKGLHDRLVSRFQWGLCVDIQPPDLETRVAILKKKAERDNLNIQEDILYFIGENISSNIRELEGVIIRLLAFASITKTDITIDLVKNILGNSLKSEKPKISIDEIIERTSDYFNIPVNNLREKNRSKEVAHCRQVAMYIAKSYTNHSLKTIGLHFGGRDHSTVIHAINLIKKNKQKDKTLDNDINYILSQLKS